MRIPVLCIAIAAASAFLPTAPAPAQCPGTGAAARWVVGPAQRSAGPLGGALAFINWDPDGAGPAPLSLVAAGGFTIAGAASANRIAMWDGLDWKPIGAGFDGFVYALAIYNNELIAAGTFTASGATACNRIARWNAAANGGAGAWQPLGSGIGGNATITTPVVRALTVYNNRLYVGGLFATAGGVAANHIASWDGALWRTLGTGGTGSGGGFERVSTNPIGYTPRVNAMAVFDGRLYVGGAFDITNGVINRATLSQWDGSAWLASVPIGNSNSFLPLPEIRAMAAFASGTTANTTLYLAGDFTSVNGVPANYVASYPKSLTGEGPWAQLGTGLGGPGEKILLQSGINSVSGVIVSSSSRFDLPTWTSSTYRFASGVWNEYSPETTSALAFYGGNVVAGVQSSGTTWCAKRVGSEWQTFGNGLNATPVRVIPGPGGADLYAFGNFTVADQQTVNGVARLDAAGAWHPVGSGVLSETSSGLSYVVDAAVLGNDLFVAGHSVNNAANVRRVMRFNGATWSSTSIFPDTNILLRTVGSELYLGSTNAYRWTGLSWQQVGGSSPTGFRDFYMYNGALHASAGFGFIYRLDGAAWTQAAPIRSGFSSAYRGTVWNNRLFVGVNQTMGPSSIDELVGTAFTPSFDGAYPYDFFNFNGQLIVSLYNGLAKLDGTNWNAFANLSSYSTLSTHRGDLIVTPTTYVNTTTSPIFARLVCCPADFNRVNGLEVQDIFDFLNAWLAGNPAADFNGINGLEVQDIFDFLNAWLAGC